MKISEADANLKIGRWHNNSSRLIVDVSIGQFSIGVSGAKVLGFLDDRLILSLPTGQLRMPLSEATFENETVEHDSLTIHLSKGGSCYLQASEPHDPEWPKDIGA